MGSVDLLVNRRQANVLADLYYFFCKIAQQYHFLRIGIENGVNCSGVNTGKSEKTFPGKINVKNGYKTGFSKAQRNLPGGYNLPYYRH